MRSFDYDIIIFALPRWDGKYSSTAYSLAKELATKTRVFYIDNPFTVKDFITDRKTEQIQRRKEALLMGKNIFYCPIPELPNLISVTPELTLPINWLPSGMIYTLFSRINDSIFGKVLLKIKNTYNLEKYIFINSFNPLFGIKFPKGFTPNLNIYHCVDDISQSEYIWKHGAALETQAIKKADLTFVTSSELRRLKLKDSDHVHLVPNAADVELFQQAVINELPKPKEFENILPDKKVIVYTGNICQRLDYDLLVKIAKVHSDKILMMIGPTANDNYKVAGLDKMPNVIFTGRKKIEELPAYLKYSHCCIIPFLCIPLTKSIYPLKINEYLSAGKPVITTNFSDDIATFADVAFVCNTHEEFIERITDGINHQDKESVDKRVGYAANNSWSARANDLIELFRTYLH